MSHFVVTANSYSWRCYPQICLICFWKSLSQSPSPALVVIMDSLCSYAITKLQNLPVIPSRIIPLESNGQQRCPPSWLWPESSTVLDISDYKTCHWRNVCIFSQWLFKIFTFSLQHSFRKKMFRKIQYIISPQLVSFSSCLKPSWKWSSSQRFPTQGTNSKKHRVTSVCNY